jgi:predicted dehydrogenase
VSLRVGILGFGGAGQAHSSYFACVPGCRVTKVFDPKPAGLARAAALVPAAERGDDLGRFWRDLDAVSVCTPDSTHADYVVAALERGLHVLCEKPLTDSLDGIRRMHAARERHGRVVAVLHQMRFVPLHRKIKTLVERGRLGGLSYLEGYYVHHLEERAYAFDEWRRTDAATPLVYAGCHFVDLLRWLTGEEIEEIYAAANHLAYPDYPESDLNVATLRFASGAVGKVVVAFGAPVPQDHSLRVYGTEAGVENNLLFDRSRRRGEILHSPMILQRKLLRDPNPANGHGLLAQLRRNVPAYVLSRAFAGLRLLARRPDAEYGARFHPLRLYEHALACVLAVEDFVEAIRRQRPPLCPVEEGAQTVLACLAGVESYRTGRPVKVPALKDVV